MYQLDKRRHARGPLRRSRGRRRGIQPPQPREWAADRAQRRGREAARNLGRVLVHLRRRGRRFRGVGVVL